MTSIRIRDYRANDLVPLIDLFRGSVRKVAHQDYSQRQILVWAPDHIDPEIFAQARTAKPTWVAEIDEQIAGFIDLEPDGHIDMLYVHADHQLKGVARALLDHVEKIAIQYGLNRLYAEVSITAHPAFEHKGFRVVSVQTVTMRGEEFTNYRMEKWLAVQTSG